MDDKYKLEEEDLEADSGDEFQYNEVPVDDEYSITGNDFEDYETALNVMQEKDKDDVIDEKSSSLSVTSRTRPEVVEDFVRNFLVRKNMLRTLDTFQTEWYEFKEKGLLKEEDCTNVPDVYVRNHQLDELVNTLKIDVKKFKETSQKAKQMHIKLRKERDFYRMHHKRVDQEKDRLISEIKRMKKHYESYEPTLNALRKKYETAMREKMLTKLERDRAVSQIEGMQTSAKTQNTQEKKFEKSMLSSKNESQIQTHVSPTKHSKDSEFPEDKGINPLLSAERLGCPHLTRNGGFRITGSFNAHKLSVSGFALHPRKKVLATVSDDRTWSLWSLPDGEVIMSADAHDDWLSDCDFNPVGTQLVTTSGDTTVKIWDFEQKCCLHTFTDHTYAVWGCDWHWAGDFIASCAIDGVSKILDLNSLRCRSTLRGHADSVNSIEFLSYSNTLCTCSADKTVSLWDARTTLCEQTFYGHIHSVNHATFNLQGDLLASGDAYGVLNVWDVRNADILSSTDIGPHSINRVAFDPGSNVVACASNDGLVKLYEIGTGNVTLLTGHEDAVQTVIFDKSGEYLLSGSSDTTVKLWS